MIREVVSLGRIRTSLWVRVQCTATRFVPVGDSRADFYGSTSSRLVWFGHLSSSCADVKKSGVSELRPPKISQKSFLKTDSLSQVSYTWCAMPELVRFSLITSQAVERRLFSNPRVDKAYAGNARSSKSRDDMKRLLLCEIRIAKRTEQGKQQTLCSLTCSSRTRPDPGPVPETPFRAQKQEVTNLVRLRGSPTNSIDEYELEGWGFLENFFSPPDDHNLA